MITIKEIARSLGMSTTTVSNVIHGKTGQVSPETIERVQKFLEEVDYVPNINARNLAQNESRIIGVAMKTQDYKYPNLMNHLFDTEGLLMRALSDLFTLLKLNLLPCCVAFPW